LLSDRDEECNRLRQNLDELQLQGHSESARGDAVQAQLADMTEQLLATQLKYESLQKLSSEHGQSQQRLIQDRDAAVERMQTMEPQIRSLSARLEESQRHSQLLGEELAETRRQKEQLSLALLSERNEVQQERAHQMVLITDQQQMRVTLAQTQEKLIALERALAQRDLEVAARNELRQSDEQYRQQAEQNAIQWQQDREHLEAANRQLTVELEATRQQQMQLTTDCNVAREHLEKLRSELTRFELNEQHWGEQDSALRQTREELRDMRRQRDEALMSMSSMREITTELRDELNDRLESFETLQRDKEGSLRQLDMERQQSDQLREECRRLEHVHQLDQQQLTLLAEQQARWNQRQEELTERVQEMNRLVEQWQSRAHELEQRAESAEQQSRQASEQLDQQQQLARRLRSRRFGARDESPSDANPATFSFHEMRLKAQTTRDDDSKMHRDPRFGRLYRAAPNQVDNLTEISGLTAAAQDLLKELGVHTFRQIMEWDAHNIREFAQRLDVGNTILESNWVGQARRLHRRRDRSAA
jgi:predicted flap endonuclease-1-like 5' DNA nuclease